MSEAFHSGKRSPLFLVFLSHQKVGKTFDPVMADPFINYNLINSGVYPLAQKLCCLLLLQLFDNANFRSSHRRCSVKKVLLEISQNSQGSTCARDSSATLLKKRLWPATLFKKRLWHRCSPVNFAKFLRTLFYRTLPDDCFAYLKKRVK